MGRFSATTRSAICTALEPATADADADVPHRPAKADGERDEGHEVERAHDDGRARVAERVERRDRLAHGGDGPDGAALPGERARRLVRGARVELRRAGRASRRAARRGRRGRRSPGWRRTWRGACRGRTSSRAPSCRRFAARVESDGSAAVERAMTKMPCGKSQRRIAQEK